MMYKFPKVYISSKCIVVFPLCKFCNWQELLTQLHYLFILIYQIVREWVQTVSYHHALPERYLRFASGTILTYGSYGLGVSLNSLLDSFLYFVWLENAVV